MEHALRVAAGHSTPLGTAEDVKAAVNAAIKAGNFTKDSNGVIRGTVMIQGAAHEFTCGTGPSGEIIFSNIYRK